MADELLSAVIRLENQIQRQLQQEQARAIAWLAGVRMEQENLDLEVRQNLAEENQQIQADAERAAKQAAAVLEAREKDYCRNIEEIRNQVLLEVLGRQLMRLLPGPVDDHQDVKN